MMGLNSIISQSMVQIIDTRLVCYVRMHNGEFIIDESLGYQMFPFKPVSGNLLLHQEAVIFVSLLFLCLLNIKKYVGQVPSDRGCRITAVYNVPFIMHNFFAVYEP